MKWSLRKRNLSFPEFPAVRQRSSAFCSKYGADAPFAILLFLNTLGFVVRFFDLTNVCRTWRVVAGLFGALWLCAAASGALREWTDVDGREIEASLLGVSEGTVEILRSDGEVFEFPFDRLSEADQAYVRKWVEENPGRNATRSLRAVDWPDRIEAPVSDVEIVQETNELSIYRTEHFEFRSDARLSRGLVRQLAEVFEATYAAVDLLPIGLDLEPPEGNHFVTRLFSDYSDYLEAGGAPNSAGLFHRASRTILIPVDSLGLQKTSTGFTYDSRRDKRTLIHEITHQVMHSWLDLLPIWVSEGLASYMETIPYQNGQFHVRRQNLEDYLEERTGPSGPPWPLTPIEEMLNFTQMGWNVGVASGDEGTNRHYYSAAVLVHYFLHIDGEGEAERFIRYLQALRSGLSEEQARALLLDGRDYDELEKKIVRSLGRKGIRLVP